MIILTTLTCISFIIAFIFLLFAIFVSDETIKKYNSNPMWFRLNYTALVLFNIFLILHNSNLTITFK